MIRKNLYLCLVVLLWFVCDPGKTFAQTQDLPDSGQASRYLIGDEEQMLLPVNIVGLVKKPGQYMVHFRTDLMSVISFAGGFVENAKINEIRIIRKAGNTNASQKAEIIKVDLKKYFNEGDLTQIPELKPDDTILVRSTAKESLDQFFGVMRQIVVVAQIAFYVAIVLDYTNR